MYLHRYSQFYPLYIWTQSALPLVIAGDMTILDLIKRIVTELTEIANNLEININYETIINELIDNEEFYNQFIDYINNYISTIDGIGNIIGYHSFNNTMRSVGTNIAGPSTTGRYYTCKLKPFSTLTNRGSTDFQLSMTNFCGLVIFEGTLLAPRNSDTGPLDYRISIGTTQNAFSIPIITSFYKFFQGPDKIIYAMPYGSQDNYFYIEWRDETVCKNEYTETGWFMPMAMYTSGQAINSLPVIFSSVQGSASFSASWLMTNSAHHEISNADIINMFDLQ